MSQLTREGSTSLERRADRRVWWALGTVWVLGATALQLLRSTGVPVWDTVWAEDGYFLADALDDPLGSLFVPLAGYLQVTARLIAALAASLPIGWASEVLAGASALTVSLLSVYVFAAARDVIGPVLPRVLLAALIALLPVAAIESTANAANLQYFLLFACFWAVVHDPRSRLQMVAGTAIVVATGLNTVFAWLYVPLAIHRWRRVSSRDRIVLACYGAAIAIQAIAVFIAVVLEADPTIGRYPVQWAGSDPTDLPGIYGLRVAGTLLLGTWNLSSIWSALGWWFPAASSIAVGALLVAGLRRGGSWRSWILVLSGYSLAMFAVPVLVRGTEHLASDPSYVQVSGARYTLTPIWFLYAALAASLWWRRAASGMWPRIGRTSFVILISFTLVAGFSQQTFRSNGPRWSTELEAARQRCEAGTIELASIPITPYEEWRVVTTCGEIGG